MSWTTAGDGAAAPDENQSATAGPQRPVINFTLPGKINFYMP